MIDQQCFKLCNVEVECRYEVFSSSTNHDGLMGVVAAAINKLNMVSSFKTSSRHRLVIRRGEDQFMIEQLDFKAVLVDMKLAMATTLSNTRSDDF